MELLALERVQKRFRRGARELLALDDVSLELFEGDFLTVLGEPRSGKTTLLRVAAGIEHPDAGEVRFAGRDVSRMSRRERVGFRRHEIGCVWKDQRLDRGLTVASHVALPLTSSGWSRANAIARSHELLRRVSAEHCADALLPELSASELVRVAIAQAVIREPKLLLADEPTETLNMGERERILDVLRSIARDCKVAVLMTAGDATGAVRATRFASLTGGRLLLRDDEQLGRVVEFPSAGQPRDDRSG